MGAAITHGLFPPLPKRFRLKPPEPVERDIHKACKTALDWFLLPPALWFPYPAGASQLTPQQMARHSEIGLKRGMPDLLIIVPPFGRLYGIELKRPGGRLSKTRIARSRKGGPRVLIGQVERFAELEAAGMPPIAICHSVEEVLAQLERWDIPLRR